MKYVSPSVRDTAFNCPHCGVLTTQYWYRTYAEMLRKDQNLFLVPANDTRDFSLKEMDDGPKKQRLLSLIERMKLEKPFLWSGEESLYSATHLHNVNVSRCYECSELSIWLNDAIIYPRKGEAPPPNPDLPEDIRRDYLEASSILDFSPRGAAALVRLSIQKLCKELGQPGENINSDIKALVAAGLDARVQKALDVVRVVGNNAVHPGKIDLTDDRATAETLFRLLNLIAEKMISEPKHVDEVYEGLPEDLRKAIEDRDRKKN